MPSVVLYRILYATLELTTAFTSPGASRTLRMSPGAALSYPAGATYHGSLLGGGGAKGLSAGFVGAGTGGIEEVAAEAAHAIQAVARDVENIIIKADA